MISALSAVPQVGVYFTEEEKEALLLKSCIEQNLSIPFDKRREVSFRQYNSPESCHLFAKMCRIAMEAGELAFRIFFTNQHSPDQLTEFLATPDIHKVLRRLRIRRAITEDQWRTLYPKDKSEATAENYDLNLLLLLAKYACQLRKPQPYGWNGAPVEGDSSSGAALVRYQLIRRHLASLEGLSELEYHDLVADLRRILSYFGGDRVKRVIHELRRCSLTMAEQNEILSRFKAWHEREEEVWDREIAVLSAKQNRSADIPTLQRRIKPRERPDEKMLSSAPSLRYFERKKSGLSAISARLPSLNAANPSNPGAAGSFGSTPTPSNRWSDIKTGMLTEEKVILEKFYDRITSEVKPDAVIDHLTSKKLLSMEESNEIFSTLKSSDQMAILIECLVPKSGFVFQELLNSLKGRYNSLHNDIYKEYEAVMKEILASKPEGVPYCKELLIQRYLQAFSAWKPIPWYRDIEVNLEDFYCDLQLLDTTGKVVSPFSVFNPGKSGKIPRWVVIEGEAGTGKSTMAKYLSFKWASNQLIFTGFHVKLLIYIDLKILAPNIKVMMIEQLFGGNFKLTERELWDVVEENQEDCLFLLDGYEENVNEDIQGLLMGNTVAHTHVLLFSHSNFTSKLQEFYDRKYILTGFTKSCPEEFVLKYIQVTNKPKELFSGLLSKLTGTGETRREEVPATTQSTEMLLPPGSPNGGSRVGSQSASKRQSIVPVMDPFTMPEGRRGSLNEQSDTGFNMTRQRAGSIFPGPVMGFGGKPKSLRKAVHDKLGLVQSIAEDSNQTNLPAVNGSNGISNKLQGRQLSNIERISALKFYSQVPLYCSFFCAMTDLRLSIDLTSWTSMIEHFLTAIKMKLIERDRESRFSVNKSYTQLNEIALDTMKNGLSTVFVQDRDNDPLVRFGLLQEATNLTTNENTRFYFPNRLLQEYLAAKCLDMFGQDEASRLFQSTTLNRQMHNVAVFYCGLRKSDYETLALRTLLSKILELNIRQNRSSSREEERRLSNQNTSPNSATKRIEGRIMDYQLSLECMAVMDGRLDMATNVVKTMPERIVVKYKGIIPILTLQGLSYLIQTDSDKIKEIDIRLDHLSRQTPEALLKLGEAIHRSSKIETLRIFWQQKEIMSDFLSTVCESNRSIHTIQCVDESRGTGDRISGKTWGDLRRACRNMSSVKSFAFKNCRHLTLVNAVIRNLPPTLEELDLSFCDINIISSQDLATKLVNTKNLRSLVMRGVRIEGMAFNTFIKALCTNRSIHRLCLMSVKLDNVCFFALSEALKMNNKLEELDLRQVNINARSCEELGQVMKINNTLKHIKLSGDKIDAEGRDLLRKQAKQHVFLEGLVSLATLKTPTARKSRRGKVAEMEKENQEQPPEFTFLA